MSLFLKKVLILTYILLFVLFQFEGCLSERSV